MAEIDFGLIFEASPTASVVLSPDLVFRAVNRAFERITGLDRAELIGRPELEVPAGPSGQGPPQLRASLERVLTERETDIVAMLRYDLEDARAPGRFRERYWNTVNAPVLDSDGKLLWIVQKVHEITPFVDQLRKAAWPTAAAGSAAVQMQQIEVELFDRARELNEVNQRLRRAQDQQRRTTEALHEQLRRHREAVADTSHDLKGPITGLQTRLQDALADPDTDLRHILLAALHDAERLGDIVSDLLELAELESGNPTETEPVDLADLVETELAHRPAAIPVIAHLRPHTVVKGSPVRLARLLDNLLSNAERHARTRIEIILTADDGSAILQITDDGPGIPAAERHTVFERFHRRPDARRKDPAGTGLGLPIARQIAHTHHGTLHIAEHTPGTCIILRLPQHRPKP
ncbi:PAS domain S-box-containing protein [Actinomadura madurae]|uniref:Sensor-like histidine kinase SenX3 n=1 Tax=Actinomadura madurae TaxID=1993 RepID=A0A1I5SDL9_9ACTN|nr:PAS domain-containing sensor histidine kinase [Actinomadura madurae]SFP68813.1 PAS domain S-box-containing protein [Actinomadura madurae]